MNIWYSTGEYKFLSNLAYRPFVDKLGREYVSVEHAYQTLKSGKFDNNTYCKKWKAGRKFIGLKANKNTNINLMYRIMKASFIQNPLALKSLLYTQDKILTHNQDRGIWRLKFPELLMQLRAELAEKS